MKIFKFELTITEDDVNVDGQFCKYLVVGSVVKLVET